MDALPDPIPARAAEAIAALVKKGATVATAESCTGGLIGGALTSVPGSSAAVFGGFITYANDAKIKMIDVANETLTAYGAVSEQTAAEMAKGARQRAGTDFAIAVTGIAGPDGGTADKPVGLVWFGLSGPDGTHTQKRLFGAVGRDKVRTNTVLHALDMLVAATTGDEK